MKAYNVYIMFQIVSVYFLRLNLNISTHSELFSGCFFLILINFGRDKNASPTDGRTHIVAMRWMPLALRNLSRSNAPQRDHVLGHKADAKLL